jgi:hypothetical protein
MPDLKGQVGLSDLPFSFGDYMAVYELFVDDFFVMFEPGTASNPQGLEVDQQIIFNETIRHNHKIAGVRQSFNLGHSVTVRASIRHMTVSQQFGLWQQGAKPLPTQGVVQILAMWDRAKRVYWNQVTQTLVIIETITPTRSKPIVDTLSIIQTVIGNVVRAIALSQTLNMKNNGVGYLLNPNFTPNTYSLGGPNGSPE